MWGGSQGGVVWHKLFECASAEAVTRRRRILGAMVKVEGRACRTLRPEQWRLVVGAMHAAVGSGPAHRGGGYAQARATGTGGRARMSYVRERPWIEGGESVVMVLRLLGGAVDQGGNDRDVEAMAEMLRVFA